MASVRAPVGYQIRRRRKALGFTQAALAREAGISASYLNLIEADKRSIGGTLLRKIAGLLDVETDALTGRAERHVIEELRETATESVLRQVRPSAESAADLVSRHPDWARALLALHRAYRDQTQSVAALSDRLNQDPVLADTMHQMLTQITAIRSASEIIVEPSLDAATRDRFLRIIAGESARLSESAQTLSAFFDQANTQMRALTPADEVDDFLVARGNHFARLEDAVGALVAEIDRRHGSSDAKWAEFLESEFGVRLTNLATQDAVGEFRNQCTFDHESRTLAFLENADASTRRFQIARLAAELALEPAIEAETRDAALTSAAARAAARRALSSYCAGAQIFPYETFLEDAERVRYDVEILRQRYSAGFEQVAHRLVTLRRPGAEGVSFAFMRTDPAGQITKRFPLPRLALPRHGHACPLWAAFQCFQTPGRLVRQLVEFPDGGRYVMIARTVTKQPAMFHEMPFLHAVMLACDVIEADRTVYVDGLDTGSTRMATAIGTSCRVCPRADCRQRGAPAVLESLEPNGSN